VGKGLRLQLPRAGHRVAVVAQRIVVHPPLGVAPLQLPPRRLLQRQAAFVAELLADVVQQWLFDTEVHPDPQLGALLPVLVAVIVCGLRDACRADANNVRPQVGGEG